MIFLTLLIIPIIVIALFRFFSNSISWKETAIHFVAALIVTGVSAAACYYSNTSDTEVWNGVVREKKSEKVSCSHSYQCNCHPSCSGTGKSRTCTTVCSTCYEHSYDIDWNVYTSNGEVVSIDRVNRQGTDEPQRWSLVKIGEPTARTHSYENYIKGSPDSLFRKSGQMEVYKESILTYPHVHDYYRMNRLLIESGPVADVASWNNGLSDINARLGSAKQVNAMVVITTKPRDYYFALEQAWIGGKKNDAVLVIGVDSGLHPVWVEVMAWVLDNKFKVLLKEEVLSLQSIEAGTTLPVFEKNITALYKRKPMHDFEYLKASIVPTTFQWTVSIIIGLIVTIGLGIYFHMADPFGDEGYSHGYGRRLRY